MKRKSTAGAGRRFLRPEEVTEALDRVEDRLDGIADRLNALWDRVVEEEAVQAEGQIAPVPDD